jgi:hypothetical protein
VAPSFAGEKKFLGIFHTHKKREKAAEELLLHFIFSSSDFGPTEKIYIVLF